MGRILGGYAIPPDDPSARNKHMKDLDARKLVPHRDDIPPDASLDDEVVAAQAGAAS